MWKIILASVCAVCLGFAVLVPPAGSSMAGGGNMFSKFGFGKTDKDPTRVSDQVGAELVAVDTLPAQPASEETETLCHQVSLDGLPPDAELAQASRGDPANAGFVIRAAEGEAGILLLNSDGGVEAWDLTADDKIIAGSQRGLSIAPDQSSWIAYSIAQVGCLFGAQVAVAVSHHNPRPSHSLYRMDMTNLEFERIADAEVDTRDIDRYFSVVHPGQDLALLLRYSDRQRKSAEIYHNHINHLALFSPEHPNGLELLQLGIDQGNIERFFVQGKTLYLQTVDARDSKQPKRFNWSLDLSRVL